MLTGAQVQRRTMPDCRGACLVSALICVCVGLAWQLLTVHFTYGGNQTGLFVTGSRFPSPPSLVSENLYVLPNSTGYDGQMYHYVAHDPFLRRGFAAYVDSARLRYRRILLPGLAFILALGRQPAIDVSYIATNLLFLFLGAWWLGRYLAFLGHSPALSILLVLAPAVVTSLDRLTVDLSLTGLSMGFLYYARIESRWRLYALLVLACLSRETGFALTLAFCLSRLAPHRFAQAAFYSTTALPAGLWYLFVNSRTPDLGSVYGAELIPLAGIAKTLLHPFSYPFSPAVNGVITALDYLVMAGILMACCLAFSALYRNRAEYIEIAISLWALAALCLPYEFWQDCCSSGRVFTPLLILLVLPGVAHLSITRALPLILVSPRTWLQLVSPMLGIVRGILHYWR